MSKSMNADDFWWSNHGEYFIILSSSDNPFTGVQVCMHLRKGNLGSDWLGANLILPLDVNNMSNKLLKFSVL